MKKIEKLINSLNILKIHRCHFDRSLWNIFEQYSSRIDNISQTYNHQINSLKDAKIALLKKDYEPDTIDIHIPYIHF